MRVDLLTQRWVLLQALIAVLGFLAAKNGLLHAAWNGDSTWITTGILVMLAYGWTAVTWRVAQCGHYLNGGRLGWLPQNKEAAKLKLTSRVRPYQWLARSLVMLGFFGTVWGMKMALAEISGASISDAHSASVILQALITGFSVALWTTITGITAYFVLMAHVQLLMGGYERLYVEHLRDV